MRHRVDNDLVMRGTFRLLKLYVNEKEQEVRTPLRKMHHFHSWFDYQFSSTEAKAFAKTNKVFVNISPLMSFIVLPKHHRYKFDLDELNACYSHNRSFVHTTKS